MRGLSPSGEPGPWPPPATAETGAWRATVALLLASAMGVSVLPSFCLGVLAQPIIDDLRMSRAEIGIAVAAVSATTAIASVGLGAMADRWGGRLTLVVVFGFGMLALIGAGLAPSSGVLVAAMVAAGLCQAGATPATNLVVLDTLGLGRRGLLTGVKQAGEMAAVVAAGAVMPLLAIAASWRGAMVLAAAVPAVGILATRLLLPRPVAPAHLDAPASPRGPLPSDVRWLTAYTLVMGLSGGAISTYLPLYAHEAVGLSVTSAGHVLAVMGLVAIGGRIAWGQRAERTGTYVADFGVLSAIGAAAAVLMWAAVPLGQPLLWFGAVLWGLSQLSFGVVMALAVIGLVGRPVAGRASGVVLLGFSIGLMIGPILFGLAVDVTGRYDLGFGGVFVILLAAVGVSRGWAAARLR